MLREIRISDFALIEEAVVQFGEGFNVLTGETGAGKTVVVEAVSLLLGGRADVEMVRGERAQAEIQGRFLVPEHFSSDDDVLKDVLDRSDRELILTRILTSKGRSKCYANGRLITVSALSRICHGLVDLHSQHEHQSLLEKKNHVIYLDGFGGAELLNLKRQYQQLLADLSRKNEELASLKRSEAELRDKRDLLEFQIREIDRADVDNINEQELVAEREILRNYEQLNAATGAAHDLLRENVEAPAAIEQVAKSAEILREVAGVDKQLDRIGERLNGLALELDDCGSELRGYLGGLSFSPDRLREVEDRLAVLGILKKKYGATVSEIKARKQKAWADLEKLDCSDSIKTQIEADIEGLRSKIGQVAIKQRRARHQAAVGLESKILTELKQLNMVEGRFGVRFSSEESPDGIEVDGKKIKLQHQGIDEVEFYISPNKGEKLRPLVKIASGGESSRVMLALKVALAGIDKTPILIFDEIDSGVGGKTASLIGNKLNVLAESHQVLAVTHLPQIAGYADRHFYISKKTLAGRTVTEVEELTGEDRVEELARMLSGKSVSASSRKHARELLEAPAKI